MTKKPFWFYSDGGCSGGNPGGYGMWAFVGLDNEGNELIEMHGCVGKSENVTNNVMEYEAIIHAIAYARANHLVGAVFHTDSKLVEGHLMKGWKVNEDKIKPLYDLARGFLREIQGTVKWVPREMNRRADRLCAIAYQEEMAGTLPGAGLPCKY